ncbi:MAG: sugar lactone lactonase YvrE [Pseudoalteromonas tetraodonis]|jgi:sugar lactone lactonase YvrE
MIRQLNYLKFAIWIFVPMATADTIETITGNGEPGFNGDGATAVDARINNPFGVEVGPGGHVYFCDTGNHIIRMIDRDSGTIRTIAGIGGEPGYSGNGGPATEARLNEPYELRFDRDGHLFFVEMKNHLVRRIDAKTQRITTVAGTGEAGFSGDGGRATKARLNRPHSIILDGSGDLFICDIGNHRIRKVEVRSGKISTYCGNGKKQGPADGANISPETGLKGPRALAIDAEGNFWLALREGNQVVKFDRQSGRIEHIAGTGKKGFTGNGGAANKATLSGPKGIVVDDKRHRVYLADTESHSIRAIDFSVEPARLILIAGDGKRGDGAGEDPQKCRLARPHGVGLDPESGDLFIGDSEAHKVRRVRVGAE